MMLACDFIEDAGTRGRSVLMCFFCWSCGDTKAAEGGPWEEQQ